MSDEWNKDLPEEKPEEELSRQRDRRRRKKRLLIFYISAFSAVVIAAVLLCVFVFFRVDTVKVFGGKSYRQEDILSVCNIQMDDNLVLLATEEREAELEHRFPYIEKAEIKRRLPSTVEVHLTEATTAYSVEAENGYLYVSRSGKVLEIANAPRAGSAIIRGTTPTVKLPSEQITFEEEEASLVFEEITAQLREKDVVNITDVDMTNRYDVTMTYDGRIQFRFGNTASMRYKMAFGLEMLNRLIEEGAITEETLAEIDLTMVPDKQKAVYREVIPGQENTTVRVEGAAGRVH